MKKKTKAGRIMLPDCKLYYKAVITKTAWYWHKHTHINQLNRKETPEMDHKIYDQLITDKSRKKYPIEKSLFIKCCWKNWTATYRRMKVDHSVTPYTKRSSKWMKDINVRQESIKILEEIQAVTSSTSATVTSFKTHLQRQGKQAKVKFWDFIKIKSFCTGAHGRLSL